MSSSSKPWWEKITEFNTPAEKEEFLKGIGGAKPSSPSSNIIYAIIAGYVGGRIAQRKSSK
jgi:hypothetical protein